MGTSATELRKWVQQHRLAEAREKAEMRNRAPDPARALSRGLGLVAFARAASSAATISGRNVPPQDLRAYQRWARLRATLRVA